jgi:hypothetical protein
MLPKMLIVLSRLWFQWALIHFAMRRASRSQRIVINMTGKIIETGWIATKPGTPFGGSGNSLQVSGIGTEKGQFYCHVRVPN